MTTLGILVILVVAVLCFRFLTQVGRLNKAPEPTVAPAACGSCDPVSSPEQIRFQLSPQEMEQRDREEALEDRRDALEQRLERLFSKIDYDVDPTPYGRLAYRESKSAAKEILDELGHIYAAGATFGLWSEAAASDPSTDEALRKAIIEIASLLYLGLRQQTTDYLQNLLKQWGVPHDFVEEVHKRYDEYKPEHVNASDFDYEEYDD